MFLRVPARSSPFARPGRSAECQALFDELHALEDEVAAKEIARIRQGAYGPFEPATLDLLAPIRSRWPAPTMPEGQQLAERLGVAGPDDSIALAAGATAGSYDTNAADVSVFGLTFRRPDIGLPAFIDWLCAERCTASSSPSWDRALGTHEPSQSSSTGQSKG
jgi:hypothetical protein